MANVPQNQDSYEAYNHIILGDSSIFPFFMKGKVCQIDSKAEKYKI